MKARMCFSIRSGLSMDWIVHEDGDGGHICRIPSCITKGDLDL